MYVSMVTHDVAVYSVFKSFVLNTHCVPVIKSV